MKSWSIMMLIVFTLGSCTVYPAWVSEFKLAFRDAQKSSSNGSSESSSSIIESSSTSSSSTTSSSSSSSSATPKSWKLLGTAGFSPAIASNTTIAIHNNGTPYVAFQDWANGYKATVMYFTNGYWTNLGGYGITPNGANDISIAFDNTMRPYIAYQDWLSQRANVMYYNAPSWTQLGASDFSTSNANYLKMAIDSTNGVYVAFQDVSQGNKAVIMRYNGISWNQMYGAASFGEAYFIDLTITNFRPFIVYQDWSSNSNSTVRYEWGGVWQPMDPSFGGEPVQPYNIVVNQDKVYVALKHWLSGEKAAVWSYNAGWTMLSNTLSDGATEYISLAFSSNNIAHVAYRDNANGGYATVKYYSNDTWHPLGNVAFSTGTVQHVSLAFHNNTPYVVFMDYSNSTRATVMYYGE